LLEQIVDTFVANDIFLVGESGTGINPVVHVSKNSDHSDETLLGNSVMVCTGANACGKVERCLIYQDYHTNGLTIRAST